MYRGHRSCKLLSPAGMVCSGSAQKLGVLGVKQPEMFDQLFPHTTVPASSMQEP